MTQRLAPPTTPADLAALREDWDFEAKLARGRDGQGAVPAAFWETYSAFANTDGGWVVLGAKEHKDRSLEFVGVGDAAKVETELWDCLGNRNKVSVNLLSRGNVSQLSHNGQTLIVIYVPKASRADRPVFIGENWERGTYVRVHEGDRLVPPDVVRRMLADAQPDRDATILNHFSIDDLDPETVRRYRDTFALQRPQHSFTGMDTAHFLCAVGAWGKDRATGREGPTVGGLLMLGREAAIRERYPHWHLSYRELPVDTATGPRWVDRLVEDGTWEANLFNFYLRAIPKLLSHLKTPFALGPNLFRQDEGQVHEAIREALVNAIIHADYEGTTGVRAIRHPTSFAFVNPGLPLVSIEQLWQGGTSEPRNPVLQRLFTSLKLGEREGSGGPAILQAWAGQHWRRPAVLLNPLLAETTLELSQESLLPDTAVATLVARWGREFHQQDGLGRSILVTAQVEGPVSHSRITEVTNAHSRDVTLKFQELVRRNFIDAVGTGKGKRYLLTPEPSAVPNDATSGRSDLSSGAASDATSTVNDASSTGKGATSTKNDATSKRDGTARSLRRLSPVAIQHAILDACRVEALTAEQIAVRLNRALPTVRNRYLPSLLRAGRLELLHPDTPNHPHQAYKTRREGGQP